MQRKQFTEEQIIRILHEAEALGIEFPGLIFSRASVRFLVVF